MPSVQSEESTRLSGTPLSPALFACPIDKSPLGDGYCCSQCGFAFPVVRGVPVLVNDQNSVFRISDYQNEEAVYAGASGYAGHADRRTGLRQIYRQLMHHLSEAPMVGRDFDVHDAVLHIQQVLPGARILIIGAGDTSLAGNVIYTDVAFGKNVACIADAHDLPFANESFDACIAVAVLEHVVDPQRCVAEIQRILKPGGFVFAETPFLQPVHMRAYDFTRFTHLGHRRLFRFFDEFRSGMAGGPAMTFSLALRYGLIAMSDGPTAKKVLRLFGLLVTYPVRYLDLVAKRQMAAYDSASGFYFFGTLRTSAIPDRDILKEFRGA